MASRSPLGFGTTIMSGKYDFGMLVASDSWAFKLDGTKCKILNCEGKEEDEVVQKIFHLGNDPPPYIIYAFSGYNVPGLLLRAALIRMMEHHHKTGRVLTSKEYADYQKVVDPDSLTCGATFASYGQRQKKKQNLKKVKNMKKRKEEDEDDEKKLKLKEGKNMETRKQDEDEDDKKELKLGKGKKLKQDGDESDELELKLKKGMNLKKRKQDEDEGDEMALKFKEGKESEKEKTRRR